MPGRRERAAGERLDVQRLRVLPVDPVADAAQPRQVALVVADRDNHTDKEIKEEVARLQAA